MKTTVIFFLGFMLCGCSQPDTYKYLNKPGNPKYKLYGLVQDEQGIYHTVYIDLFELQKNLKTLDKK